MRQDQNQSYENDKSLCNFVKERLKEDIIGNKYSRRMLYSIMAFVAGATISYSEPFLKDEPEKPQVLERLEDARNYKKELKEKISLTEPPEEMPYKSEDLENNISEESTPTTLKKRLEIVNSDIERLEKKVEDSPAVQAYESSMQEYKKDVVPFKTAKTLIGYGLIVWAGLSILSNYDRSLAKKEDETNS